MARSQLATLVIAACWVAAAAKQGPCQNLTEANNKMCYDNVEWAKTKGIEANPQWYTNFPFLNESSALSDFQYFLAIGEEAHGNGSSWNCSIPCVLTAAAKSHLDAFMAEAEDEAEEAAEEAEETAEPGTTTAPTQKERMSIWWWVLIAMGVCCCCPLFGLACSAFLCYESVAWICEGVGGKKPEKKKKRAIKPPAASPPQQPAATPAMMAPVQTFPVHLPTYQPMNTYAAPQAQHSVVVAPPVQYAAPAAPVAYAQPVVQAMPQYLTSP